MNRTYYELAIPIKPGFALPVPKSLKLEKNCITGRTEDEFANPKRWLAKEHGRRDSGLPHVFMANCGYPDIATPEAALQFVGRYGPTVSDLADIQEAGERFEVSVEVFGFMQHMLRRAWERPSTENLKALWLGQGGEELAVYYLPMAWTTTGVELRPANCWTYLRLLLVRDFNHRRARVCANPSCPAPFFVAKRNNQKFCGWDCTNLVQQRNFRKRRIAK